MRILIAPNASKGSCPASAVAKPIEAGLKKSRLKNTCHCFPIGDGGDGTGELIIHHLNGEIVDVSVQDPLGENIHTTAGLINNRKNAVIEMANASGLRLLNKNRLNRLWASSFGTGESISQLLDRGVTKIIIGMGGSATVDGGTGILSALGIGFFDSAGNRLDKLPQSMVKLHTVDTSRLDKRISTCEILVLCDVTNHLLGEAGSAKIFGPQKGVDEEAVQ